MGQGDPRGLRQDPCCLCCPPGAGCPGRRCPHCFPGDQLRQDCRFRQGGCRGADLPCLCCGCCQDGWPDQDHPERLRVHQRDHPYHLVGCHFRLCLRRRGCCAGAGTGEAVLPGQERSENCRCQISTIANRWLGRSAWI